MKIRNFKKQLDIEYQNAIEKHPLKECEFNDKDFFKLNEEQNKVVSLALLSYLNDENENRYKTCNWGMILLEEVMEASDDMSNHRWFYAMKELAQVAVVAQRAYNYCKDKLEYQIKLKEESKKEESKKEVNNLEEENNLKKFCNLKISLQKD